MMEDDYVIWDNQERKRIAYMERHNYRCECCAEFIEQGEEHWTDDGPVCPGCFLDILRFGQNDGDENEAAC